MATLIGVVSQVIGEVFAVAGNGARRTLAEGDRVFAGEQLVTGASGAVAIALVGGGELTLGRDSNLMLDTQLLAGARGDGSAAAAQGADSAPSAQDLAEVEQLQAAIEAGEDPTASLAATAAGPGAGAAGNAGGGHSFVLLDETAGALDPVIGFPTEGLGFIPQFPDPDIEAALEVDSIPAIKVVYDNPSVESGAGTVDEAALPGGSSSASPNEATSGYLLVTSPDGVSSLQVQLQVQNSAGEWIDISVGGTVTGQYGTLTFDEAGNWVYTITTNTVDHNIPGATGADDQVADTFAVRVIDTDGDISPAAPLIIQINDDGPVAVDDSRSLGEESDSAITGEVLANDHSGADSPASFVSWSSTAASYGTFSDTGNGTYSYLLDSSSPLVQGLSLGESLTETFTYTMQDADGDTDTATLTITIQGADDGVIITGLNQEGGEVLVDEDDLPGGTDQSDPLSDSGTFSITALDGIATISIGETTFTYAQLASAGSANLVINSPGGVLVIDGYSGTAAGGTVSYTYTLQAPVSNELGSNQASESFAVVVTDEDGSFSSDSLDVIIIDDQPIAALNAQLPALGSVKVDESLPELDGVQGDGIASATLAAVTVQAQFDSAYGADGAGSTAYSLALSGSNVASGLFAVDPLAVDGKGAEIVL
ncbi:retention module-containing protein, partial [Pseudomonas sp.]|uniref:retention module-containing protein n=1 Tax=Pseudomonas sp. TaxID=306 RepID=UPI0026054BBB